jgi:signal transduction histidine kinase
MTTLKHIYERIESKKLDYAAYRFSEAESNAFKSFFDLAQEFDEMEDFYNLCVAIPKSFFGLEARLYAIDIKLKDLVLVAKTEEPGIGLYTSPPQELVPREHGYVNERGSLVLAIHGKEILRDQLPFKTLENVLGILEVYPAGDFTDHNILFFEKYANRIGFNMHNRYIMERNIEHLRFIRSLVNDIEHNIIVPNMIYRLLLRNLKDKINKNLEVEKLMVRYETEKCGDGEFREVMEEFKDVNSGLVQEFENIEKHYKNMSLFLETLLRRSHFDKGRLTLRTKECNMMRDVVRPQLERLASRFSEMDIPINQQASGLPEEEMITVVDVGLMSQVYANLFSNALKYTEEITDRNGEKKKYVSYGHEVIKDYFGPGKDGIKYNVFSTGRHIPEEERGKLFEDGYRGSNAAKKPGTGHGLAFIKNIIELHGGVVGYEATEYGNNFYFILPR